MAISVYYNLNHHYFKCNYSPPISECFYHKGIINKHNIMFVQSISSQFFNKSNISKKHNTYLTFKPYHKNNWYMWKK